LSYGQESRRMMKRVDGIGWIFFQAGNSKKENKIISINSRKVDAASYLKRIGYRGPLIPHIDVLRRLHHRHLLSVPFENLDIHLDRRIILDQRLFYKKIVEHRRGGYSYELNGWLAKERRGYCYAGARTKLLGSLSMSLLCAHESSQTSQKGTGTSRPPHDPTSPKDD